MSDAPTRQVADAIAKALTEQTCNQRREGEDFMFVEGEIDLLDVAQAAIDALQLTEEREDRYGHRGAVPYVRLIGPWVEGSIEQ